MTKHAKFHLAMIGLWILLVPPVLLWWKESILVVILISIYANIIGHWSAYEASTPTEDVDE